MVAAGVDVGAKTIKIIILEDDRIIAQTVFPAGYAVKESLKAAWADALDQARLRLNQIERILSTGAGRKQVIEAHDRITEVSAVARGAIALDPRVRTVVDLGAEEARAIRINAAGRVLDFAINEKCAAGTGAFLEAMARALEVTLDRLGPLSLQSTKAVALNAQCVVFAESELVTLVHSQTPKPDMARAVHDAIADRIVSLIRRIGMEREVLFVGGVARNIGLAESLKRELGTEIFIPESPETVCAYGAALLAAEKKAEFG
jgi:predicted CoA-substrate-specific enzyme activase